MAKKKKPEPDVAGLEVEETSVDEAASETYVNEALTTEPDPARIQRGLGALHESFKAYKAETDRKLAELKGIIEGVGRRIRGGQ